MSPCERRSCVIGVVVVLFEIKLNADSDETSSSDLSVDGDSLLWVGARDSRSDESRLVVGPLQRLSWLGRLLRRRLETEEARSRVVSELAGVPYNDGRPPFPFISPDGTVAFFCPIDPMAPIAPLTLPTIALPPPAAPLGALARTSSMPLPIVSKDAGLGHPTPRPRLLLLFCGDLGWPWPWSFSKNRFIPSLSASGR